MKKFTRRHYNKRLLALGLSAFMGIGLVSTGFAAWVMSKEADENVSTGVNVSTITDASANIVLDSTIYTATGDTKILKNTFSFDAPLTDTSGRLYSNGIGGENLAVEIKGRLYTDLDYTMTARLENLPEGIIDAIEEGYIAWKNEDYAFTTESIEGDLTSPQVLSTVEIPLSSELLTDTDGDASTNPYYNKQYRTFTFKIEFAWGDEFGGVNPSLYYDGAGSGVSDEDMQAALQDFWYMITGEDSASGAHESSTGRTLNFTVVLRAEVTEGA